MYKMITYLIIGLLAFGMGVNEASAKRFGGGRSFGVQRSKSSLFSQKASKANRSAKTSKAASNHRRWGGLLGGMLIGGLLTSLFMGHGMAQGLMTWLILGSVLFFLIHFFRQRMQPAHVTSMGNGSQAFQQPFGQKQSSEYKRPYTFNEEGFLREAKSMFFRLQAAYDQKNLQDISEFTAPEVFAEIKMQLDEMGNNSNKTEVLQLEAELLDISHQAGSNMASVRFSGFIKEDHQPTTELNEIWHFRQFTPNDKWLVGGIQQ